MYIYKRRKWKVSSFDMLRYNGIQMGNNSGYIKLQTGLPIFYSVYDIQMYKIIYYIM
jgi:hypothetical protein